MSNCDPNDAPDFKLIVDRTIAVFAVYTGATLSFYVKDFLFSKENLAAFHDVFAWASYWGSWVVIALIALLLRYIVGSAVHLNRTYVPKETLSINGTDIVVTKTYRSKSLCWLFFDMLFLISFGVLAFFITTAASVEDFMMRAIYFMSGGLAWSVVAIILRPEDRVIATKWAGIDLTQIVLTGLLIYVQCAPFPTAMVLAGLYLFFLLADFYVLSEPA
jgi:hypothetical protein